MASPEFQFIPPPEAPTFRPTWEEFQDALQYINKIRPVAEQYGVCKIIPPPDWQPPFAVDVDNFKFTPRIQRINELEAHTRIKLNFLDQIAKFWELQGSALRIPVVEKKALDLYSLHKKVQDAGGADAVTRHRAWNRISGSLGFAAHKNVGSQLKHIYERILQPFDIFNRSKEVPSGGDHNSCSDDDPDYVAEPRDYKPHQIPSRMAGKIPDNEKNGRRSRRYQSNGPDEDDDEDCTNSKELKRLQFKGPGPKNADVDKETKVKGRNRKTVFYDHDPLAKYICLNCGRGDAEEHMLLCDGCDDSYHTFCLMPSLTEIPKGDWRCPKCVAVEVSKPLEAFGFEQAQKEYTLQSFGEMADKFKQDYFNMPVHLVPLDMAEREYWRIVSSIDEDVTVEYGADLHTMDHGSGFPTLKSSNLMPADKEYATDSWNLNNLPVQESSVLAHIGCDISGMKVPWMYVGMCFSTFCWHNEDHWSYSINYLHWGEPKTWYGVPGGEAEKFEACMKLAAPELFESQPDLLHQLVTIMNPNILMKEDLPIVRCDQHAGEFIITFPRSYHAGFNQGYNFAEAVNFAPPDWLSIGRECITHYSNLKRYCVFSHDELVCKMAASPDILDLTVAAATYQDMLKMVDSEKRLRKALLHWGVKSAEREAFEVLPDDERQCDHCKTTCFLSAVTCSCTPAKLVCLRHYTHLCDCAPHTHILRYRYTLDELPPMLLKLKERAESFDNWASKVKHALEAKHPDKLELEALRELVVTAEVRRFPDSELLGALLAAVAEADKCAAVAAHLAAKKIRTRTRGSGDPKSRLTLEELQLFYDQIITLGCTIKEGEGVRQLLDTVVDFQEQAIKALAESEKWMSEWQMQEEIDDEDAETKLKTDEDDKMEVDGDDDDSSSKPKKNGKKKKKRCGIVTNGHTDADGDVKMDTKEDIKKESSDVALSDTEKEQEECKVEVKKKEGVEVEDDDENEILQSEELSRLLEAGLSLDIELPELSKLRHRLHKVTWLEEVQDTLDPPSSVTAESLRRLLSKSLQLPPHVRVESTRVQLTSLLQDMEEWDKRAAALLQAKQCSVSEAEQVLRAACRVPAQLPAVCSLRDAVRRAREWQTKAATVCRRCQPGGGTSPGQGAGGETSESRPASATGSSSGGSSAGSSKPPVPVLEAVEALLHRARPIPLRLPEVAVLEEEVTAAQHWLEKTAKTFLKKNSHCSLMEVLIPRTDIGLVSCPNKRKRLKRDDLSSLQQAAALLDMTPDQASNPAMLVRAYKDCEDREIKAVRALRAHNMTKLTTANTSSSSSSSDLTPATFCVCHKAASPAMLQCSVCCDKFHAGCVPSSSGRQLLSNGSSISAGDGEEDNDSSSLSLSRFICPCCHRSRRPKMDTILALLMALQKIHVRLCEAGALQCLTERAMAWQDRAQQLLRSPELTAALHTLTEAAALLQGSVEYSTDSNDRLWNTNLGLNDGKPGPADNKSNGSAMSPSRVTSLLSGLSQSPDRPLVNISQPMRQKMKDVLMEGELLEVTMEETVQLWRLLQVSENPVCKISKIVVMLSSASKCSDDRNKKNASKKRKSSQSRVTAASEAAGASGSANKNANTTSSKILKTGVLSPKRAKLACDEPGSAKKLLKQKSSSTSKLLDCKKKDDASGSKTKKRTVTVSQSSSNLQPTSNTPSTKPNPNKSPKKLLQQSPSNATTTNPPQPSNQQKICSKTSHKKQPGGRSRSQCNNSASSSDDDEMCAASRCKIPVGASVDWVQCDKCNGWFHYVCVGLKASDLTEDEDYICATCNGGGKASSSSKS